MTSRGLLRLGRAPVAHSPEQAQAYGLNRHPSLEDVGRRTLLWNPEVLQAYSTLSNYLRDSTCLSARDREIAILRQAWDSGSDYQWAMHAKMALDSDLTSSEVERIAREPEGPDWAPREVAIMRAVDDTSPGLPSQRPDLGRLEGALRRAPGDRAPGARGGATASLPMSSTRSGYGRRMGVVPRGKGTRSCSANDPRRRAVDRRLEPITGDVSESAGGSSPQAPLLTGPRPH